MKAIVNGNVYTPGRIFAPGTILIEKGRIVALGPADRVALPPESERIDAGGRAVAPGFIDLHGHGLLGHDSMGSDLAHVIQDLPRFGVTAFLATTLPLPRNEMLLRLEAMAQLLQAPPAGARCLGIHLEGPFLSPDKPGMATPDWFEPLTPQGFEELQAAAGGRIRLVTLAPEVNENLEHIPHLLEAGVIPAIGHSNASFEQVAEAVRRGLRHAAHTFNAMRPLHHRRPGVVGAVMYFDEIVAELIADGVHVHPAVVALLLRIKGLDRVALVSDAAPLAGLPEGEYAWEQRRVYVQDGTCRLSDGTLAGAHALLDTGVRNLIKWTGWPLEEALVPATRVPGEVLGLRKGRLAPGYDADLVILDEKHEPALTMVGGEVVHRAH